MIFNVISVSRQCFANRTYKMKALWLFVIFSSVLHTRATYSGDSELCRPWTCIKNKLGLSDQRESTSAVLRALLPLGAWQEAAAPVLDVCHNDTKPRRYSDTCPGQAALHCIVDQLIKNCPVEHQRKDDACAPVSSLAGFKYMFSQSTYENIERNIHQERHPASYMRHYFSSKCCNLPDLINSTILSECRFEQFMKYYDHKPPTVQVKVLPYETYRLVKIGGGDDGRSLNEESRVIFVKLLKNYVQGVTFETATPGAQVEVDPLSCCDLSGFINTSDVEECAFELTWNNTSRLVITDDTKLNHSTTTTTTTTPRPTTVSPVQRNVVKVVPISCEKETCVFRNLNIISESGEVDTHAFTKLLDNFTRDYPEWVKAKARVVTKCLSRPIGDYEADCEINKILACTFDVLTENCPHAKKGVDPCKHSHTKLNGTVCQISTSKYGPKNRRRFCDFPRLVAFEAARSCGVADVSRILTVPDAPPARPAFLKPKYMMHKWLTYRPTCKQTAASATCLMTKMGVLSKYKFLDHFKMKDKIREFTSSHAEWMPMQEVYLNSMVGTPHYRDHCTSQKKLMNVIDAMLTTCPATKRRDSQQCNNFYNQLTNPNTTPNPAEKAKQMRAHFEHMYLPRSSPSTTPRPPFNNSPYKPTVYNSNLRIYPRINFGGIKKTTNGLHWGIFRPRTPELQLRYPGELNVTRYSRNYPMTTVLMPIYRRLRQPKRLLPMLRSSLLSVPSNRSLRHPLSPYSLPK